MKFKNTSLWWRIFVFVTLFVFISGQLGPQIINHSLIDEYGFAVYGGAGKSLLFAVIAFGLLVWRVRRNINLPLWRWYNLLWLIPGLIGFAVAWNAIKHLQRHETAVIWPLLTHVGIVATIASSLLLAVSWPGIQRLWHLYRREVLISLAVGLGYYILLTIVYGLWEILATTIMHAAAWLLTVSGLHVQVLPPRYLVLDKFGIEISQYCSGIESIALFTGLYTIIGIIDRGRLNFRKYTAVFIPALIAIFGFNILRVYGLIMYGYYVNKDVAFKLFHTYAGMIFFILFSALFWAVSYKWMLVKSQTPTTQPADI